MPTPPTGDIACAASPMQRSPGRYHRRSRSTLTVSSFTSSQEPISPTRSRAKGARAATCARKASRPRRRTSSAEPLGITKPHCQWPPRLIWTKIRPTSKRPVVSSGSPGTRDSRNQNTSMGAPRSCTGRPAASRSTELRPSAATTRSARISNGPPRACPRTPVTRPRSSMSPVASACISRWNGA